MPAAHLFLLGSFSALLALVHGAEVFQWSTRQEGHKESHGITGTAFGVSCAVGVQHHDAASTVTELAIESVPMSSILIRDCGPLKRQTGGQWTRVGDPDSSFPGRPDEAFPLLMLENGDILASDEEDVASLNS